MEEILNFHEAHCMVGSLDEAFAGVATPYFSSFQDAY